MINIDDGSIRGSKLGPLFNVMYVGCYFGVNEILLTQHILGPVTKYKLL